MVNKKKKPARRPSPRLSQPKSKPKRQVKSPMRKGSKRAETKTSLPKLGKADAFSLKSLAEASLQRKVQAVALHPKTKRPVTTKRSGMLVIYGIKSGRKVEPISMDPQKFSRKDMGELGDLLQTSASAQQKGSPLRLRFFQTRTKETLKTPTGKNKERVIKSGPQKGRRTPIFKTKISFTRPKKSEKWRQLLYLDGQFQTAAQRNFQRRSAYEEIKAEVLNKIGFSSFEEKTKRFLAGFNTGHVRLTGKTLTEALINIQPPVSNLWLKKNKVVLKFFKKNRVGNIHVEGNVYVTVGGVKQPPIPILAVVRYMGELPGEIGKAIRAKLADSGATYTNPIELAKIESRVENKYRKSKGGLKSKKAAEELRRLVQPGRDPHTPKLLSSLRKIQKGHAVDFPLAKTDNVVVNLNFRFYRDVSVGETKKKRKRKK